MCVDVALAFLLGNVCLVNLSLWLLVSFIDYKGKKSRTVYQTNFAIIYKSHKMI